MLYFLTNVILNFILIMIWYYCIVLVAFTRKITLWCVNYLLFLSRFTEHVTGARVEEKPTEEVSQVPTTSKGVTNTDTKLSKGKVRQRGRKANEEPTFNTKLSTPIEDIIEETLNEEKSDSQSSSQASERVEVKPKKKKKSGKKGLLQKPEEDSEKFLFVKQTQASKSKNQKKILANQSDTDVNADNTDEDDSFVPVKDRSRKTRNKPLLEKRNSEEALNAVIAQGITKKKDSSRAPIIEHFKIKKNVPIELPTKKDPALLTSSIQELVNPKISAEVKESKKVTSKVSYANIVTNSVPANFKFEDLKEETTNKDIFTNTNVPISSLEKESLSSVEVLSQCSEDSHSSTESGPTASESKVFQLQQVLETENGGIENNIESSFEVLEKSGYSDQKSSFSSSHFEENLLFSVKKTSEASKDTFSENYIENHFSLTQQGDDKDGETLNEAYSENLNDQVLQDIFDDLKESNNFEGSIGELETFLSQNSEESKTVKSQLYAEESHFEKQKTSNTWISQSFITSECVSEESSRNEYLNISTAKKEDNSEKVEPFITSEVQPSKVEPLFHSYIVPDIVYQREVVSAQNAELVIEEPFNVKSAYLTSETPQKAKVIEDQADSLEETIEDQIQSLEDQIIEKPFTIEEVEIVVPYTKADQQENLNFNEIHSLDNRSSNFVQSNNILPDIKVKELENLVEDQIQNLEDQIIERAFIVEEVEIVIPTAEDKLLCVTPATTENTELTHIESEEKSEDTIMTQIRVLTLNDKEHQESTIYRIEKKFVLQFRLGPSLLGRRINLYCNYPKNEKNAFDRECYQLLPWCQDEGCKNADDTASFAQIVAQIAGSFHYYFTYVNEDTEERQGSGYFIVDPVLIYGSNEILPLDCIQCQTVLAKHLGPFSTWESKLRVAKESGYNVLHFTPIQELGFSNSSYSLSEQLKLNPMFNEEDGKKPTFNDVEKLAAKMRKEWKVLSICDIVLNHTANESEWIKEHPEATYNCVNCPYMRPAYLLDAALDYFSMEVKKGNYEDRGVPAEVSTEDHLNAISYHFKLNILEPLKIYELFTVDVNKCLEEFLDLARRNHPVNDNENNSNIDIEIIQDPEYRRLKSGVNMDLALKKYNSYRLDCFDEESRVRKCAADFKMKLDVLNQAIINEVNDDLNTAVENVIAGIRYFRVQADGPRFTDITISHPLVYRYFTDFGSPKSLSDYEEIMYSENGRFLMAHNGWVMNSNPLKNFADVGTKTYIRRELIAWGDSVKLRFGNKPEDSPFLWDYMRQYVEQTVKIFDGVRLDNCHSTPIPVAEYLLDCARKVRPDLLVVAELFTNSDLTDNIFVNRLGITSLIREAMSAWDSHEEGRLVYRYGGVPVGSFYQPNVRPLVPMVAHALFLDLTHDNPSPIEKRSVFDLLPSTALVNMACCASGSNRGYDELVPHHIHVVDETRQYTEWSDDDSLVKGNVRYVNSKSGIIAAKRALNDLHFKLGIEGYNQVYVDQMDPDIVAVTRHNAETHTSYVLVAFTAFSHPDINSGNYQRGIKPLRIEGVLDEIVLEASFSHIDAKSGFKKFENFIKDSKWIHGLSEYQVSVKQHIQLAQSDVFEEVNSEAANVFQLNFKNFKPGSIAVVKISLPEEMTEAVTKIRGLIRSLSAKKGTELSQVISKMTLADLNRALYRCGQEERDEGNGFDAYNIPNFGPMVYCGLQGFMSLLANIRPNNDLGHPFCANLRDGNWMIEYVWKRLKVDEGTKELGQWIEENTKYLERIPRYLVPCYFDVIITGIYVGLLEQSYNLMSDFVKHGSTFVRGLSLGSLQFGGYVRSADLPVLSPNLAPPKPPTRKNKKGENIQACVTLSAGLPHFSVGYMRNWGRDTFIALRGLFILTGRFEEARQHILGYAACLRHGLIPNLLDGGRNSRFNCRDALWWWLYCIKSYCEESPNGLAILSDVVSRIFPTDDSPAQSPGSIDQPLHDVIQEALKVHFQGLKFRERNAGRQIDEHMTDTGFINQIGIHPETGFVFGGNQWNCGTWMDKMGSSDKAGNRGKPATPRDGSAVELVGLSKAAISWLSRLHKEGKYPYDGIERVHKNGLTTKWTFAEWADKIQNSFEKKFWVGAKPSSDESRPDLINKKNIYKDSFGGSQPWTDYQMRCNFPIAMVAAPEMFDPQHAWAALEQAEKYLLGPLGMKTLDPEDWNYRGDYDNSNDSDDFNTSHGFNYHQGPEWVWPIGFFLRAKLIFAAQNGQLKETLASTKVILSKHFTELQTSPWRGLPELTNSNGAYCRDSSRTQAWSMSCILEVLYDLQQIESKEIVVN